MSGVSVGARDHGLDPVRIAEGADAQGWSETELALIAAADEMYRDAIISDETWGRPLAALRHAPDDEYRLDRGAISAGLDDAQRARRPAASRRRAAADTRRVLK